MNAKDIITAILALRDRVEQLEARSQQFDDALSMLGEDALSRLDALESRISSPVVVDSDGVLMATQEALLADLDQHKKEITDSVESLRQMFHQHLADHELNGARTRSMSGRELHEYLKEADKGNPLASL